MEETNLSLLRAFLYRHYTKVRTPAETQAGGYMLIRRECFSERYNSLAS